MVHDIFAALNIKRNLIVNYHFGNQLMHNNWDLEKAHN